MNKVYVGFLCVLFAVYSQAQGVAEPLSVSVIEPYRISVNDNKTTNLIFPFPVRRVHCASKEVDVEQMKDVKNILLVQSFANGFSPTNLSVVTNDGKFYSFLLEYGADLSAVNIRFGADSATSAKTVASVPYNEALLKSTAEKIICRKRFLKTSDHEQLIRFAFDGIYMSNDLMWFSCSVRNRSGIGYPIDYVKVFVRDRLRSKRTVVQEREISPVFTFFEPHVPDGSETKLIMAFEPFTISSGKKMLIQLAEKGGGRFLELKPSNGVFYKTRALVD